MIAGIPCRARAYARYGTPQDDGERAGRAVTACHPEPGERRRDDWPIPQFVERRQDVLVLDKAVVLGLSHLHLDPVPPAPRTGRGERRHSRPVGVLERQRRRTCRRARDPDDHHRGRAVGVTQLGGADEVSGCVPSSALRTSFRGAERRSRVVRHGQRRWGQDRAIGGGADDGDHPRGDTTSGDEALGTYLDIRPRNDGFRHLAPTPHQGRVPQRRCPHEPAAASSFRIQPSAG